ncbi:hypothetical protein B0T21DRAFT_410872 [Apiosordaria backusii]|uniref:Uncharacterized protein n=1 Tax=Apiosordaria backusii TaxID=314023 RepID=A0AA40EDG6_9PEZI|nr:hypothetical protein B0T21DRAFT_410872 [Apiosordaria backusii]
MAFIHWAAHGYATTAIFGIGIVGCFYVATRLILDLITRHKTGGKQHRDDDVESDTPSHSRRGLTAVRLAALAGVITNFVDNILNIVNLYLVDGYREAMARFTAQNFFTIAAGLFLFITAILMTTALTSPPLKGKSASRIACVYSTLMWLITVYAVVVFILQAVQIHGERWDTYRRLRRAVPIIGHVYFGLLGLTTLAIGVGLIRRIIHARRADVPTAERCALHMFTYAALPILTVMMILGIVFRAAYMEILDSRFDRPNGYLAYSYISMIVYTWGVLLVFEFARKARF